MKSACPNCQRAFFPEDMNLVTGVARCPACGQVTQLAGVGDPDFNPPEIPLPPKGAWYRDTGTEQVFGATTRSSNAVTLVLFSAAWSGLPLGIFYGLQILRAKFSLALTLIGAPFLLGSVFLWFFTLQNICGKVEVRTQDGGGMAFVGIGRLGWRRGFAWDEIEAIEGAWPNERRGRVDECVVLRGKKVISFGRMLSGARQHFMVKVLRCLKARHGRQG